MSEHPFPIRAHERKRLELMGVTIVAAGGWSASYPCQNADWARGSRERHQPHDRRRRRGARRSRARARRPDDLTRRWQIVQHRPGSRSVGSATGFRRPGVQRRLGVRPAHPACRSRGAPRRHRAQRRPDDVRAGGDQRARHRAIPLLRARDLSSGPVARRSSQGDAARGGGAARRRARPGVRVRHREVSAL